MSATKKELGTLHGLLTEYFRKKLEEPDKLLSGDVQNILRFLKDNGIEATADAQDAIEKLSEELASTAADREEVLADIQDTNLLN